MMSILKQLTVYLEAAQSLSGNSSMFIWKQLPFYFKTALCLFGNNPVSNWKHRLLCL